MSETDLPARWPRRRRSVPVPVRPLCLAAAAGPWRARHQDRAARWRRPQPPALSQRHRDRRRFDASSTPSTASKESLALDLKNPADIAALRKLLGQADVVLQNFRPGVIERLGLDYEAVKAINPGIVYASITGYGERRPVGRAAGAGSAGAGALRRHVAQWRSRPGAGAVRPRHCRHAGRRRRRAGHPRGAGAARPHRAGRPYRNQPARSAGRLPVRGADHPSQRWPPRAQALPSSARPMPISRRPMASIRPPTATSPSP